MASLDIHSLFTNIPLDETIDICVDNLYNDNKNPPYIPKHDFCNLLNSQQRIFMFSDKYYKQVDGVAMGSPLGPALANIFMSSLESKSLRFVLMISNLYSMDVILMTYLHCFFS